MSSYEVILSNLFDLHASIEVKSDDCKTEILLPWFNDCLKKSKTTHRKLERKMLKTQLRCDKDAFKTVRNKFSALFNASRSAYHSELIESCAGDFSVL